jgi:branched-chain amino acid transport system substrate-binding protein
MSERGAWSHKFAAICMALLLAAGIAACGGDDDDGGAASGGGGEGSGSELTGTIPITFVGDMTGPVAYVGKEEEKGMKIAVEEVNSSGMLGDAKLELTVSDTGSDQNKAVQQMNEAVRSDAAAILGPLLSNEALAAAPIAQRAKVPYVATQSQNDGVLEAGEYIYRLTTSQLRYDNLIANHLAEKGVKTVKMVYANDNPTLVQVSEELMPEAFDRLGIELQQNTGIPTTTTDFSSLVTKLTSGNPDAIGMMLVGAGFPGLIKALDNAGYKGLLFGDSAATAGTLAPAGAAADGFVYAVDFTEDLADEFPSSKSFVEAYKKAYPDAPAYGYNATGYDAVKFVAEAIKASGDASREGVLEGMQKVAGGGGFDGAVGPLKLTDPDNRDVAAPGALVEWRDGREHLLTAGDPSQLVQPVKPAE